jgi:hypothetical protein
MRPAQFVSAVFLLLATASLGVAANRTYSLADYPANQSDLLNGGADSISGTIVTDGTLGYGDGTEVVSAQGIFVTSAGMPYSWSCPLGGITVDGGLYYTETQILCPYGTQLKLIGYGDPSTYLSLVYDHSYSLSSPDYSVPAIDFYSGELMLSAWTDNAYDAAYFAVPSPVPGAGSIVPPGSSSGAPWVIATVVPEPGTLTLLVSALLSLAGAAYLRRRRQTALRKAIAKEVETSADATDKHLVAMLPYHRLCQCLLHAPQCRTQLPSGRCWHQPVVHEAGVEQAGCGHSCRASFSEFFAEHAFSHARNGFPAFRCRTQETHGCQTGQTRKLPRPDMPSTWISSRNMRLHKRASMQRTLLAGALCAAVLCVPTVAFGWASPSGSTHTVLAAAEFSDPLVAALASPYLTPTQINSLKTWYGEAPSDQPHDYHHPDAATAPYIIPSGVYNGIFQNRLYALQPSVYAPYVAGVAGITGTPQATAFWPELDQVTELEYLLHVGNDTTVPVNHGPANIVYQTSVADFNAENAIEARVGGWGSSSSNYPTVCSTNRTAAYTFNYPATYGGVSSISFSYTGTINDIWTAHLNAVLTNATWFKNAPNTLFQKSNADNDAAGKVGTVEAEMFNRAWLVDYFLAKQAPIANAGTSYMVGPGGSVTFSAAGSEDPDSITWAADASYSNNGGGLVSYDWDINGDGVYGDVTGASPTLSFSALVGMVGITPEKTIRLRVTDNEGSVGYANAKLAIIPEPGTLALLVTAGLGLLAPAWRRRRSWAASET